MKDPAQCVKDLLHDNGMDSPGGWFLSVGALPVSPDTIILVNHTGGEPPFPSFLLNQPSVQVMVRGKKSGYREARTKIGDVVDVLLGMDPVTLQGDMYRSCVQIGDVSFIGQDDNTRDLFSANFRFIVEPATNATTHRSVIS